MNWDSIDAGNAVNPDDEDTMREIIATVDVQGGENISKEAFETGERLSLDYFVRRLTDMVPNPWQAARMAGSFLQKHKRGGYNDSQLLNHRIYLSEVLRQRIRVDLDKKSEVVFRDKVGKDDIRFRLETDERLNYELGQSFEVFVSKEERTLQGEHGSPIQRSLFDPLFESRFNSLEKDLRCIWKEQRDLLVAPNCRETRVLLARLAAPAGLSRLCGLPQRRWEAAGPGDERHTPERQRGHRLQAKTAGDP